jgi:hypothetical protein
VNPKELWWWTEDKAVFYAYCAGAGLPVPRLHGVLDGATGWQPDGRDLITEADWEELLLTKLPEDFVIKPARGVYGEGVRFYSRRAGAFHDHREQRFTAGDILRSLRADPSYAKFVVQERLRSHPTLERLSGTPFVQTVRMVTYVGPEGEARLYVSVLKVIVGDNPIDNFCSGHTGNISCPVDLERGTLGAAVGVSADRLEVVRHDRHPTTGSVFAGTPLPGWREACQLVREAALRFLPVRTIGWDVALTPAGPVIVEGNMAWDPADDVILGSPSGVKAHEMPSLLRQLERDVGTSTSPSLWGRITPSPDVPPPQPTLGAEGVVLARKGAEWPGRRT